MLETLAIANYRSLRALTLPLGRLNLVTGANGSGKSNLYRALRLLAETAQGGKDLGETRVVGQRTLDEPAWHWPER